MYVIPKDRLPEGFAERIDHPPAEPVPPRPAATLSADDRDTRFRRAAEA